jgi:uncharacterized protein (UPF0548 family)
MRAAPGTVRVVTSLGALDTAPLTYPEHGATRGPLPAGYHHLDWRTTLGAGEATFRRAAEALLSWRMHARAGLGVLATSHTARPDAVVVTSLRWRRIATAMPCRVVYTVAEPHRKGFAYGTLPGHPVRGEEAFVVELTPGGDVRLTIRAFSRPARLLARLGGPAGRFVQRWVTARYVRALHCLANG